MRALSRVAQSGLVMLAAACGGNDAAGQGGFTQRDSLGIAIYESASLGPRVVGGPASGRGIGSAGASCQVHAMLGKQRPAPVVPKLEAKFEDMVTKIEVG